MECNKCPKVCEYKNKIVCDYCKYNELPNSTICKKCIEGDCKFKESNSESVD